MKRRELIKSVERVGPGRAQKYSLSQSKRCQLLRSLAQREIENFQQLLLIFASVAGTSFRLMI